jgi:GntR family transcriptional regulator
MIEREWNDDQPIYRQLKARIVGLILDRVLNDGDPLPSVRTVASDYRINPITVLKAYQQLVDEALVEKKRGRGMFVSKGARTSLLAAERRRFLEEQWPAIHTTIKRLGLSATELLAAEHDNEAPDASRGI